MRAKSSAVLIASLALAGAAQAHGPHLDYVDGQIVVETELYLSIGTPIYNEVLAFNFANLGWQALPSSEGGGRLGVGDTIGLHINDASSFLGLTPPNFLFYYDGTSLADPGAASLSILGTLTTITKANVNIPNVNIGVVDNPDTFHNHLGFLLSGGSVGVYGLLVDNTTSNPSVAASDPYLILLNNGLTDEQFDGAVAYLNELTEVPEASSLSLAGAVLLIGGASALRRKMRRC